MNIKFLAENMKKMCFLKGYEVPDYWAIGEVYERLIEDVSQENVLES